MTHNLDLAELLLAKLGWGGANTCFVEDDLVEEEHLGDGDLLRHHDHLVRVNPGHRLESCAEERRKASQHQTGGEQAAIPIMIYKYYWQDRDALQVGLCKCIVGNKPADENCVTELSLAHQRSHLGGEDLLVVLLVLDLQHVVTEIIVATVTNSSRF